MILVRAGRVLKAHGIRGILKCAYTTDNPELLPGRRHYLLIEPRTSECVRVTVEDIELKPDNFLAKFAEFTAPEPLRRYHDWEIAFATERGELPREDGEIYYFELEGMEVRAANGSVLGVVTGVYETGAHVLLEVGTTPPALIPFNAESVPELSLEEGWLVTSYPLPQAEGMEEQP